MCNALPFYHTSKLRQDCSLHDQHSALWLRYSGFWLNIADHMTILRNFRFCTTALENYARFFCLLTSSLKPDPQRVQHILTYGPGFSKRCRRSIPFERRPDFSVAASAECGVYDRTDSLSERGQLSATGSVLVVSHLMHGLSSALLHLTLRLIKQAILGNISQ